MGTVLEDIATEVNKLDQEGLAKISETILSTIRKSPDTTADIGATKGEQKTGGGDSYHLIQAYEGNLGTIFATRRLCQMINVNYTDPKEQINKVQAFAYLLAEQGIIL
ncbi:hypothetical protein HYX12_01315 [Candidatus Woesearchaeota archaeon]|nr:hypothetical protein [Candidatus Woesearchaeota archaeon]